MSSVLDASAVLAYLHREPGWEVVQPRLEGASLCAVNWSEVAQKTTQKGLDAGRVREFLLELGLEIAPFSTDHAEITAKLWQQTQQLGLSLADRACLALAIERQTAVLTADRAWADLKLEVAVELLR